MTYLAAEQKKSDEKEKSDEKSKSVDKKNTQDLFKKLQSQLDKAYFKGQYRDDTKKERFSLDGSFLLGTGSTNALGATAFETPHKLNIPSKKHRGVCLTPVLERRIPKWKQELYKTSVEIIKLVDPDFAEGEFLVNFSKMTSGNNQYVKKHVDSEDISFQYALGLGDAGATLRCYDKNDDVIGDYDFSNRLLKMDGRLPNELITTDFIGTRYCIIWFKLYDYRKHVEDQILLIPESV